MADLSSRRVLTRWYCSTHQWVGLHRGSWRVTIPAVDTTYWCSSFSLEDIIPDFDEEKYIIRISPEIPEASEPYVYHLLVYGCAQDLSASKVDTRSPCDINVNEASNATRACLGGTIIGAWAVGGEDFVFPEHVAFPIGGPNSIAKYVLLEMHYDNPENVQGVVDNSGLKFYYTTTRRQYEAGIFEIGHDVNPIMIIPPSGENYTIFGYCATNCTETFPQDGIRVFANFLHTHLLGIGLEVMHYRRNDNCDGGFEELPPVDRNLHYDFNYQNGVYLDNEITILPGDVLLLKCIYNSVTSSVACAYIILLICEYVIK